MNEERQIPRPEHRPQDPFHLLTDDALLYPIFEFIGPCHFRFVAGVSQRFRCLYTQFQLEEYRKRVPNEEDFEALHSTSITSAASIAESLSRAKVFLKDTRCIALQYGHVEILQLVVENGWPLYGETCQFAAAAGHLGLLQWLRANGCPWDEKTCSYAAQGCHLEVLQWARENGCPWNECTCSFAAQGGNLDVLQWVRENGCPWDEKTCASAAVNGHLDVLQWALENGCEWDRQPRGNWPQNVIDWLRENEPQVGA